MIFSTKFEMFSFFFEIRRAYAFVLQLGSHLPVKDERNLFLSFKPEFSRWLVLTPVSNLKERQWFILELHYLKFPVGEIFTSRVFQVLTVLRIKFATVNHSLYKNSEKDARNPQHGKESLYSTAKFKQFEAKENRWGEWSMNSRLFSHRKALTMNSFPLEILWA